MKYDLRWYQETIAKLWALCGGELPPPGDPGHDCLTPDDVKAVAAIEHLVDRRAIREDLRALEVAKPDLNGVVARLWDAIGRERPDTVPADDPDWLADLAAIEAIAEGRERCDKCGRADELALLGRMELCCRCHPDFEAAMMEPSCE